MSQNMIRPSRRFGPLLSFAKSVWSAIFQFAVFVAVLSFLQTQQPLIQRRIDHQNKILTITRTGFSPLRVRIFANAFDVNFDRATAHASLDSAKPIAAVSTRGLLTEQTLWMPWSTMRVDLARDTQLPFDEWKGDLPSPYVVYCLEIEARNMLSNQSVVEAVLTPKVKFATSLFGFMGPGVLGGDPSSLLATEAQIKSECLAMYEKMR
jgi:hypothetical protein